MIDIQGGEQHQAQIGPPDGFAEIYFARAALVYRSQRKKTEN